MNNCRNLTRILQYCTVYTVQYVLTIALNLVYTFTI
jgi:hypothetical protein